jgi:Spy/CpxP family protein refolding chaperone
MRTTITTTLGAVLLAGVLSATTSAVAAVDAGAHMGMHHAMKNTLMSIPNLSADQRQRITDLLNTAKNQTAPLKQQIMGDRKEMATLWAADNVDKQAIAAKQADLEGALGKAKNIWTDFFMQLHDVLTSPQRAWLALHGPGMHDEAGMGFGQECPCNQQPEK